MRLADGGARARGAGLGRYPRGRLSIVRVTVTTPGKGR